MNLAIILVHNKDEQGNIDQIEALKALLTLHEDFLDGTDDSGKVIPNAFVEKYYTLNDLDLDHRIDIYQIIPYQPDNTSQPYNAILPANFNDLYGRNVQYGKGDEDKVGDHPRFFNWGLKRSTDYGADIIIHIDNVDQINIGDIKACIEIITNPKNKYEFVELSSGKMSTLKLFKEVGQISESKPISESIEEFKIKIGAQNMEIILDG